jgi:hypothetical protein
VNNRTKGNGCPQCSLEVGHSSSLAEKKLTQLIYDNLGIAVPDTPICFKTDRTRTERINQQYNTGFYHTNIRPDVHLTKDMTGAEKDIFIEYDSYLHLEGNYLNRDKAKTELLLEDGKNIVIRAREKRLPKLEIQHENYHELFGTCKTTQGLELISKQIVNIVLLYASDFGERSYVE